MIFFGFILGVYFSLKLVNFEKFDDTTEALAAVTATVEGKISKPLKKLLKRLVNTDVQEQLLVADSALGKAIKVRFIISIQ
jgi:nucleolar protein 58